MRLSACARQLVCLFAATVMPLATWAGKQTVCTITINSADEQKTFRRFLPADKYDFVELVERGRPDWLRSACQAKVSCDVLVISGHHGEGNVFFSDALDIRDNLPIAELERVACSDSCPSLFEHLKEVYLFGCNTLNSQAQHTIGPEFERAFERDGQPKAQLARLLQSLTARRGESSRDRMRAVFNRTPVIYGFSSVAPLGAVAAVSLDRYFRAGGGAEVGKGRASGRLLANFSQHGMVAAHGMAAGDPLEGLRRDMCTFADDRPSAAQRVASVHELMTRTIDARLLLDRIEQFTAKLDPSTRQQPEVAKELDALTADRPARDRWMAFARSSDDPQTGARMITVAHSVGWLSGDERQMELVRLVGELLAHKSVSATDTELACAVNEDHSLDAAASKLRSQYAGATDLGHSAVLACMGDTPARERVLEAWGSANDAEVQVVQAFLRRRPITDTAELRVVTRAIAKMGDAEAQARALDALARHYLSDPESVGTLRDLYAKTRSSPVQNAIAGVLIRADRKAMTPAELLPTLREYRLKPSRGDNMVDSLIARLQESS
jgi:hypothetical protein